MNNTYFYIEPYAHINYDNDRVVIYETLSGNSVCLLFQDEYQKSFVKRLLNDQNRSVCFNEYPYDSVREFVEKCQCLYVGDIVLNHPPFVMPMRPKFMTNLDTLKSLEEMLYRVIPWVSNLILYTDTETNGIHRNKPKGVFVQTLFPVFGFDGSLDKNKLIEQLGRIRFTMLKTISMVGSKFDSELLQFLSTEYPNASFVFYTNVQHCVFSDFYNSTNSIKNKQLNLWVTPYGIDIDKAKRILECYEELDIACRLLCLVEGKNDAMDIENAGASAFVIPFYSGDNLSFFEQNVYLTEQDILSQKLTQQDILNNMSVNSNFFGELYFMPNNMIYANPNFAPIGKLGDDWHQILYNLLDSCWFKIRNMKPCSDCAFQYLCPPPSNYEFAIGKPNLCTVKP